MKHFSLPYSNLPPGVTDRDIDRQVEDEDDLCWQCGGNCDFCECEPEDQRDWWEYDPPREEMTEADWDEWHSIVRQLP